MQLLFFYLKPTSLKPHLLSRKIKYRLSVQSIPFKWQRTSHRSSSHEVSLAFLFYCLLTASREHKTGSEHVSPRIGLPGMQPLPWWVLSAHQPLCSEQWGRLGRHTGSGPSKVKHKGKPKLEQMVKTTERERHLRVTLLLELCIHSLSHLFIQKYLLSIYYVLGTVRSSRNIMVHNNTHA